MKKNLLSTILAALAFCLTCSVSIAQNVTLEGRQFKLNGNNFYPVVMNYGIYIYHNTNTSTYFVSPKTDYGDCSLLLDAVNVNDAYDQIEAEFQKCLDMGFNCVRIDPRCKYFVNNLEYVYDDNPTPSTIIPVQNSSSTLSGYTGFAYRTIGYPVWSDKYVALNHPYYNDNNSLTFFTYIRDILDIAEQKGIKVIILAAANPQWGNTADMPDAIDHYADYLTALAVHCSSSTSLLAYDLMNEPYWRTKANEKIKKLDVCIYTKLWYDAIKAGDPNHLITMGTGYPDDEDWDPAIMKLDFISSHFYPDQRVYEIDDYPMGYSRTEAYERWQAQVYWTSKYITLPWIIGEVGFSAQDDITDYSYTPCNTLPYYFTGNGCFSASGCCVNTMPCGVYSRPPYQYGTEAEQAEFAHNSQQYVWDCGGSGYSWWEYQTPIAGGSSSFYTSNPNDVRGHYWGILYPNNEGDKPAVDDFDGTNTYNGAAHPHLNPRATPTQPPPNYYDPNHHNTYSTASPQIVTGTVKYKYTASSTTEFPLEGAVVTGRTFMDWDGGGNPIDNVYYTFTHADGTFSITPFDHLHPTISNKQYVRTLDVTALGTSSDKYNDWWWNGIPTQQPPPQVPSVSNFTVSSGKVLKKIDTDVDGVVQNVTVQNSETFKGEAFQTLTVSPNNQSVIVQSGGTADFVALDDVHALPGFHAQTGSETHLYNDIVRAECDDIPEADIPNNGFRIDGSISSSGSSLELIFRKTNSTGLISVYPNPNDGTFTVKYYGETGGKKELKIFNLLGDLILNNTEAANSSVIDLSTKPKGIYFIQFNDRSEIYYQKIVVQ